MSLNFVTLKHVGIISRQKRRLQKSYKVDFTGPPCSSTHMHSAKPVKIIKRWDLFQNIESLNNLLLTLKSHHSGDVHRAIHDLWPHFHKEHAHHSLENLTKKRPCLPVFKKNGWEAYPRSIEGV